MRNSMLRSVCGLVAKLSAGGQEYKLLREEQAKSTKKNSQVSAGSSIKLVLKAILIKVAFGVFSIRPIRH